MKKLYMYLVVSFLGMGQISAQNLFNQTFSEGATLTTYYHTTTPSSNQFNNIISGTGNTASITSDGFKLSKKSASAAAIIRSTSLSESITFLKFQTRIRLVYNNDNTVTTQGSFQIALGDNSTNATAWGAFNASAVGNNDAFVSYPFTLVVDDTDKTAAYKFGNGDPIYGWEDITIFCNYTDNVVGYADPAGEQSTVQPKSTDLWVGTTRVQASFVRVNTMMPNKFKISLHGTAHSVDMDVAYVKIWDQNVLTLPVTLTGFNGKKEGNAIKLDWQTASEKSNSHFELLKSADGVLFEKLATVKGNENSNQLLDYQYTDRFPIIGTNYYKLKQYDIDGKSEEFNQIVSVKYSLASDNLNANYAYNKLRVNYKPTEKVAELKLLNILGKCVLESKLDSRLGNGLYEFPINLEKGIYVLTVKDGTKYNSVKLLN